MHLNLSYSIFAKQKMIPPGLFKLFKLVSLDLSSSYFQIGPTTLRNLLQNLTNLELLLMENVNAPFELPKNFPSFLRILSLQGTNMFGKVSDAIGNLTAIRELRLSGNNFTGNDLSIISKLNKLVVLDLSSNHLSGSIPEFIDNLTRITILDLSNNSFTENVLSTIRKLKALKYLSLSSNNFEGSIPNIFSNFLGTFVLEFDNNNFAGPFPYSIATLTRLERLGLQTIY